MLGIWWKTRDKSMVPSVFRDYPQCRCRVAVIRLLLLVCGGLSKFSNPIRPSGGQNAQIFVLRPRLFRSSLSLIVLQTVSMGIERVGFGWGLLAIL